MKMKLPGISVIIASVLVAFLLPAQRAVSETMHGGIAETSIKDRWVTEAACFAVREKERELQEKITERPVKLALVEILSARQQVVAGMNFYLRLKIKRDEREQEANVVIWRQLSGEHRLTSWEWKDDN